MPVILPRGPSDQIITDVGPPQDDNVTSDAQHDVKFLRCRSQQLLLLKCLHDTKAFAQGLGEHNSTSRAAFPEGSCEEYLIARWTGSEHHN